MVMANSSVSHKPTNYKPVLILMTILCISSTCIIIKWALTTTYQTQQIIQENAPEGSFRVNESHNTVLLSDVKDLQIVNKSKHSPADL